MKSYAYLQIAALSAGLVIRNSRFSFLELYFIHSFSTHFLCLYVYLITVLIKELKRSSHANEDRNLRFGKILKPIHSIFIEIF